jgi:hypothetical protein
MLPGLVSHGGNGLVIGEDWLYKGRDGVLRGNGLNGGELCARSAQPASSMNQCVPLSVGSGIV